MMNKRGSQRSITSKAQDENVTEEPGDESSRDGDDNNVKQAEEERRGKNADEDESKARVLRFLERQESLKEETEEKMDLIEEDQDEKESSEKDSQQADDAPPPPIAKKVSFSLLRRQSSRKVVEDSEDVDGISVNGEASPGKQGFHRKWMPKMRRSSKDDGDDDISTSNHSYMSNPKPKKLPKNQGSNKKIFGSTPEDAVSDENEEPKDPTREYKVSFSDVSETVPSSRKARRRRPTAELNVDERKDRMALANSMLGSGMSNPHFDVESPERPAPPSKRSSTSDIASDLPDPQLTAPVRSASDITSDRNTRGSEYMVAASAYLPTREGDNDISEEDRFAKRAQEEVLLAHAIAESLPEAVPVSEEEKCDEDGVTVDDENLEAGPDTRRSGRRKGKGSLIVRSSSRIKKFGLELLDMTAEKVGKKSRRGDARRTKVSDHDDRRQQYSASHQVPLRRGESYSSHHSHNYHSRRSNARGDSSSSHNSHRPPDSYRGSDTSYRGDGSHRHYQDSSYRDYSRRREYGDYSRGGREYDDYSRGGRDYDDYGYRRGRGDASVISEIEINHYADESRRDHYADESRSVSYSHRPSRPPPTGSHRRYHSSYQESDAGSISSSIHSAYMGGSSRQLHYRGGRDYYHRGPSSRPSSVSWDELGDPIQMALESSLRDLSCQVVGKQCIAKKRVLKPDEPILSDTDIGPWQCRDCAFVNGNGRHLTCAVCNARR